MASNFFGRLFRITTFGESHGPAIGVIIDGCPAGVPLTLQEIQQQLDLRKPGKTSYTSPRKEPDQVELLSGVFEGSTTGAPIALMIRNQDADSSSYEAIREIYRPGHANFTYLAKYGCFDDRGGGRASARETAARVAAGAVAKKLLAQFDIDCVAYLSEAAGICISDPLDLSILREKTVQSPIFCPDAQAAVLIQDKLRNTDDSYGGIVTCVARVPPGLGDPVYDKLPAQLASAMLSIPATKGFEIGDGFDAARKKGSENNDAFDVDEQGKVYPQTNHAGGVLGGISTGAPLLFRVAFKPTSSIKIAQDSVRFSGRKTTFQIPATGRHDPCVAIRGVIVVEAMTALVLADALLKARLAKAL